MHRNWWIVIGILIFAALASWLFAATRPLNTSTNPAGATSTAAMASSPQGERVQAFTASRRSDSVQAIVDSLPNTSQFQALFNASNVPAVFNEREQYTIFVPTDSAFARFPKTMLSKMTAVQKRRLVAEHIVAGRAIQANAEVAGTARALSGDLLNFTRINNLPMVDSAIILSAYEGSNGIVYVIDSVLIPPKR